MSHQVHLSFCRGEPISLDAIYRARRELLRNRATPMGDRWSEAGEYFVMQVAPEHELALLDMRDAGFLPVVMYARRRAVLPDEIGSIMGFRVVAGW